MLQLGENEYPDEWVEAKIEAKPAIRDTDLQIAISTMKRNVAALRDVKSLAQKVTQLQESIALLTQERQRQAA